MNISFPFTAGDLILPPVRVEHIFSRRAKMAIDTGARTTVITPELAEEVGVELTGTGPTVILVGVAGQAQAPLVVLRRVSILGLGIEKVRAVCHPLPPRLGLDGILGLNFLQHFNLSINHRTETASLETI